jgi:FKBP-type peptidyl-prolyl cis-trans isomerase FkpA
MKFFAAIALIATVSSIRLRDEEAVQLSDAAGAELSPEDLAAAEAAARAQIAAGAAGPDAAAAVETAADAAASEAPNYLAEAKLDDGITVNVLAQGSGASCAAGQTAQMQYTGALATNGEVFDSSIPRGEPISFVIGDMTMIKCWESAALSLSPGEKADIGCPAATAYGASSKPGIPANSDLIFNVEVVGCQ